MRADLGPGKSPRASWLHTCDGPDCRALARGTLEADRPFRVRRGLLLLPSRAVPVTQCYPATVAAGYVRCSSARRLLLQ